MALFENYDGRMPQLQPVLDKYGFKSFEDVKAYTNSKGVDAYSIVESTQPICFENVKWAYELGAAIAMKEGAAKAADAAKWMLTLPSGSASDCRHSAFPDLSLTSVRSVSATATWAQCCWMKRPNVLLSWQDTSPLQLLKAQSRSL